MTGSIVLSISYRTLWENLVGVVLLGSGEIKLSTLTGMKLIPGSHLPEPSIETERQNYQIVRQKFLLISTFLTGYFQRKVKLVSDITSSALRRCLERQKLSARWDNLQVACGKVMIRTGSRKSPKVSISLWLPGLRILSTLIRLKLSRVFLAQRFENLYEV